MRGKISSFGLLTNLYILSSVIAIYSTTKNQALAQESNAICPNLKIVTREEWFAGAALSPLQSFAATSNKPKRVFLHQAWDGRTCLDVDSCTVRVQAIQAYHQLNKRWPDISYNFLIAGDGTIFEGLGFDKIGYHTLNYNHISLGVAFIGTFHDVYPSEQMQEAFKNLLGCAVRSGRLAPNYALHGHRDARCTICPGDAAYSRLATMPHFKPGPLAKYSCLESSMQVAASTSANLSTHPDSVSAEPTRPILNINSNNQLISVNSGTFNRDEPTIQAPQSLIPAPILRQTGESELVEEAFISVLRRRQKTGLTSVVQSQHINATGGTQPHAAESRDLRSKGILKQQINKNNQGELILINMQEDGQRRQGGASGNNAGVYMLAKTNTLPNTPPVGYWMPGVGIIGGGNSGGSSGGSRPNQTRPSGGSGSGSGSGGGSSSSSGGRGSGSSGGSSGGSGSGGSNSGGSAGGTGNQNQSSSGSGGGQRTGGSGSSSGGSSSTSGSSRNQQGGSGNSGGGGGSSSGSSGGGSGSGGNRSGGSGPQSSPTSGSSSSSSGGGRSGSNSSGGGGSSSSERQSMRTLTIWEKFLNMTFLGDLSFL